MSSGSRTDREGAEMMDTTAAMERQLRDALESADSRQARFHLRQALQLVDAIDE
ncbi:hypothetical protein SAMN04488065_1504 [Haloplanus vescus]|uniref:Uncharacterized protein n=1 Tax=Haloplanus vescus TaxID=555874 RepID=A0A1H3XFZ8_9EURY|nr:hypothetical protein [Haloplanus vescus]SDZ97488.1 hypothetical protein SAMN04488065_1504 [Haloplanus vescus]